MRIIPVPLFLMLSLCVFSQEARVSILTQEAWPPGKNVPVTVEITRGGAKGFARFYHDLPQGFSVENVISSGAEFFRDDRQVNYVWLELPEEELIIIQYLARANELQAGSFKLSGRFDYVADGKSRVSVVSESIPIVLDRSAEVEEAELLEAPTSFPEKAVTERDDVKASTLASDKATADEEPAKPERTFLVDFRVQVSISSQRVSRAELENRIGSKLKHGVRILETGNMYKYHSGSFKSYEEASGYLAELKNNGVTDAFIVAFNKGAQISISEARSITER